MRRAMKTSLPGAQPKQLLAFLRTRIELKSTTVGRKKAEKALNSYRGHCSYAKTFPCLQSRREALVGQTVRSTTALLPNVGF